MWSGLERGEGLAALGRSALPSITSARGGIGVVGGSSGISGTFDANQRALRSRKALLIIAAVGAAILLAGWRLGSGRGAGSVAAGRSQQHAVVRLGAHIGDAALDGPASSAATPPSSGEQRRCALGTLQGTWVSDAPPGARWRPIDGECRLRNLLALYAAAGDRARNGIGSGSGGGGGSGSGSSDEAPGEGGGPPVLRLLLLSDSVDRHVTGHLCTHVGGRQEAQVAHEMLPAAAAAGSVPPGSGGVVASGPGAGTRRRRRRLLSQRQHKRRRRQRRRQRRRRVLQEPTIAAPVAAGAGATPSPGPTNVYTTAYSLHKCVTAAPLRAASSYFPGVHPSGPWHRGVAQSYRERIDSAASLWRDYAGDAPPHLVSVSSLLWDLARLWFHERHEVDAPELRPELLEGWMANFTAVVRYARRAFPETKVWVTHTTLPPRFTTPSGAAVKPYLGRAYHVAQLNGALAAVARREGLALVDYGRLGARFAADQGYLGDLIHPGAAVSLEAANIYLNLAAQALEGEPPP